MKNLWLSFTMRNGLCPFLKATLIMVFTMMLFFAGLDSIYAGISYSASELPEVTTQQDPTISGIVRDSEGVPLLGVNIVIKGTTTGVISDANGNYNIEIPSATVGTAILVFSYVGYESQ